MVDSHRRNPDEESNLSNSASNCISQLVSEVKFIYEMISDSTTRESALEDLNDLADLKIRYENFILSGKQGATATYEERKSFVTAYRDTREKLLRITNASAFGRVRYSSDIASRNAYFQTNTLYTSMQQVSELPTFSGVERKWPTFKAEFLQLIRDDPKADDNDVTKLRYLRRALKGDAAKVVEKMKGANFNECWAAVCQRYD